MIQLVVNVNLLREIDERKLINAYARYVYKDEEDISNEIKIKENLIQLLDWDKNGDNGLGFYCSKFESIKRKDWDFLINFIKENSFDIKKIAFYPAKEKNKKQRFNDVNYKVSGRGKKAKPCIFEGRHYKSRQECIYKENITKNQLYNYLKSTNQL